MTSGSGLQLELKPSRRGRIAAGLLHALAALALGLSAPPWGLAAVAWLAWGVSLGLLWLRRHQPPAIRGLYRQGSGWQLRLAGGAEAAELLPPRVVTPALILLRFRLCRSGRHLRCVLWPDSATAEGLRRLRLALLTEPE